MNKCLYCYQQLEKFDELYHASCAVKIWGEEIPVIPYGTSDLAMLAKQGVAGHVAVTGVQPKIVVSLEDKHLLPLGRSDYHSPAFILKPQHASFPELPQNEHLTMLMARTIFDIPTVPCSLIKLADGELAYLTRRVDRHADGTALHMLDMFQILEAYDKYIGSMEKVGKALIRYSSDVAGDVRIFFKLALFNYLIGNNDMHLKNFSMIHEENRWKLAPAYDLLNVAIVNPGDKEELALTLDGKKRILRKVHFIQLGLGMGLTGTMINVIFVEIEQQLVNAFELIKRSFLTMEMQGKYIAVIKKRWRVFS